MDDALQIDPARLLTRCMGNVDLARQLLALFREHVPPVAERLKTAAVRHDWAEAARCAHRLKGSVANLCADKLAHLALTAENAAKREHADALLQSADAVETAIADCITQMDHVLDSLS